MGSKHVELTELIERFNKVHSNKYDYSDLNYVNLVKKVTIRCFEHGVFLQTPHNHIKGTGCPSCYIDNKKRSFSSIYENFLLVHGDTYRYDNVAYVNTSTKISITCLQHGDFLQKPSHHLIGRGCPVCSKQRSIPSVQSLVNDFRTIHGEVYDYSKVSYNKSGQKIKIGCYKHGIFEQTVDNHKRGQGCPKCKSSKGEKSIRLFLDSIGISYSEQFPLCKNPDSDYHLRVDFYLPALKTVIEYDGRQHFEPVLCFGGEDAFNQLVKRDNAKNMFCAENDIAILRISYKDFKNIPSILKENFVD